MRALLSKVGIALVAVTLAHPASAVVVDGAVTAFPDGDINNSHFIILSPPVTASDPDNTIGNNNFQKPHLYAMDELQDVVLGQNVSTNVGATLLAGQRVSSHYVFFDPSADRRQEGWVEFDQVVLAIITSTANLLASDFLGLATVTYLNPNLKGLESGDSVIIDPNNANRVLVDWDAQTPGDYVRVVTVSAVPVPAALPLFAGGLGGLGLLSWWRRRRSPPVAAI